MRTRSILFALTVLVLATQTNAQVIREYQVSRTSDMMIIDGKLSESSWINAPLTDPFIVYWDGSEARLNTQSKFLWDDNFLYIGFICEDPDVWGTFENRDDLLWNGEVVEILCDPNGDELNYFEVQVNPLETILDLLLNKPYFQGGRADLGWNLEKIQAAVWVDGTLNDLSDVDVKWECEVALPFDELAFMGPELNFPPLDGDQWRILVTRYDYERTGTERVEVTSWNQTDDRGFHVPTKFGRIIFSDELNVSVDQESFSYRKIESVDLRQNYPNPFNPSTYISFNLDRKNHIRLDVFDINGRLIRHLLNAEFNEGQYSVTWDGMNEKNNPVASGIYMLRLKTDESVQTKKMILAR